MFDPRLGIPLDCRSACKLYVTDDDGLGHCTLYAIGYELAKIGQQLKKLDMLDYLITE